MESCVSELDYSPDDCTGCNPFYAQSKQEHWIDYDNGMRVYMPKATYQSMVYTQREIAKKKKADAESQCKVQKVLTKYKKIRKPKKHSNRVAVDVTNDMYVSQSEEIVTFVNAAESEVVGTGAGNHAFSSGDATIDTDIKQFFARPVRITNFTWLESAVLGTTISNINPWHLWANNSYVKNKLNNYSWFRGDLHLKIQVTASPFYYGLAKAIYQPLPVFTPTTIVNDAAVRYLIPYSQRPHVDIDVGQSDSYNMVIPFIYPANWVNIQGASNMTNMGKLETIIYSQLQSANGVTGTGIDVAIYAWIENIELSGASVGYAMQSDEFGEGCISKPASWVADTASYLEDVPIIGPFATATRIGASAISFIASMFGFTNVPVIADSAPMRSEPYPKLASSEIGYPVERLSLDPKNELSIDPRIVGMPSGLDEMTLQSIATRESYLTQASWSTTNLIDDTLFWANVTPTMFNNDNATQSKLYMTPMAYVAKAFKDWRGSIIFRFHIVCSKYHKGKLRISFDPSGYAAQNIGNTTVTANVVHTAIVDIGETRNVEFCVPYQQALQFLSVRSSYVASNMFWNVNSTMSVFNYNGDFDNGVLTVRVLNPLTAPEATSSVSVIVSVRAGNDIEFANPTPVDTSGKISIFAPQSEEFTEESAPDKLELAPTAKTSDHQYLVHYGENIRSLRQLLRRYELVQVEGIIPTSSLSYGHFIKASMKMPMQPGYKSNAYSTANTIVAPLSTYGYNFTNLTALSWFTPSYLAYRGSMNWSFNVDAPYTFGNLRVYKDNVSGDQCLLNTTQTIYATQNQLEAMTRIFANAGSSGQALTDQRTQAGINIQMPNYTRYKFQSTNPANNNQGVSGDGSNLDRFVLEGTFPTPVSLTNGNPAVLHSYAAIGVDFGLYYFLNVPTFYVYSSAPTPV
nr:MAG: hypothetical protein 2 [Marnaviridae sp.]